ncbi:MAG: SDR family NAD(P)-dependent oxidoreductase, partial [Dehalococcoidia bacterium]
MAGLEGKIALITGAGGMRGIGRATALKLAGQGVDLALTDVHRETEDLPPAEVRLEWKSIDSVSEEVAALGRRCLPVYADLGSPGDIEQLVQQVLDHYGHIDILVNNARAVIGRDKVPVTELEDDVW